MFDRYGNYMPDTHTQPPQPPQPPQPLQPSAAVRPLWLIIVIVVIIALVVGLGGGYIGYRIGARNESKPVTVTGESYTLNVTDEDISTTEAVAKKVLNSVVGITATGASQQDIFGFSSGSSTGVGTGIIVSDDGYILTNSHVVMEGSVEDIKVLLSDGTEVSADLLWNDDSIDLAIIKINATGLTAADLGDSNKVQIGSYVAAIGNPLGLDFSGSITQGVVSGLNRSITTASGSRTIRMEDLIQVDAAINTGNSGGPLLNNKGEVIGVNTAKASAEGMGFAIPINTAKPIIEKVIKTGSFERVYIGVSASNAGDIAKEYPELDLAIKEGAFITYVAKGSPADEAGIKVKDVIIEIDGNKITTSSDLIKRLLNYNTGDKITVKYMHGKEERETQVTLLSQADAYQGQEQSKLQP